MSNAPAAASGRTGHSHPTGPSPREWGVDAARGIAVISMFVAHTAPSNGPADLFYLSEFLTFPLFALMVGAGAELGARSLRVVPHGVASLIRACVLLGLGWWLAQAGAYIVIVLAPLGVLTLLCWGISRLPTTGVLGVGLIAGIFAPWTIEASRDLWYQLATDQKAGQLWFLDLWVSTSYPQAVLVLAGCVGIVATRALLPRQGSVSWVPSAVVTVGAVTIVVALSAARLLGRLEFMAYETSWVEELYVVALALGVLSGSLLLSKIGASRLIAPLGWVGAMTLTLYALQIGWLAWWARDFRPGIPDDTWVNVIGMTVVAFVLAGAWRLLNLPRPWGRGPLEGIVGALVMVALMPFRGNGLTSAVPPERQVTSART